MDRFENTKGRGKKLRALTQRLAITGVVAVLFLSIGTTSAFAATTDHVSLLHGSNGVAGSSGTAKKVKEGNGGTAALLTAVNSGYGVANVTLPKSTKLDQLSALSTKYDVTEGTCSGGSPRFSVVVLPPGDKKMSDAQVIWVYFGAQPYGGCSPQQGLAIADATESTWWTGNSEQTYMQALDSMGTDRLVAVQVSVDGGWAQTPTVQQVLLQDLTVSISGNAQTFYPLPSTQQPA
jgi:hypothetical protein